MTRKEEMKQIKLEGYKGTYTKIGETWYDGIKYNLFESDVYGDEAEFVVTNQDLEPITSGYDDIETILYDYF